jgi:haloacetate dehalogenase
MPQPDRDAPVGRWWGTPGTPNVARHATGEISLLLLPFGPRLRPRGRILCRRASRRKPERRSPDEPAIWADRIPRHVFEGFQSRELSTERGAIFARVGGSGPPLLLLHGYPETHVMWHAVAPRLAERFTVVASDLSGYGASLRPAPADDHEPHSKRALARDQVQAMASLGFDRFAVAGHDRGGRVAYRMALDHPQRVSALAVLDIVPTAEVWARADVRLAFGYWHWGFLAQPAPLPERLIAGDPDAYFDHHVRRIGLGGEPGRYPDEVLAAYRAQLSDATAVQAICEDYRAGATADRAHDEADRGRQIACPVLVLWGMRGGLPLFYDDVLAIWRTWARDVRGRGVDATHFLVEDAPDEVAGELERFF